MERKSEYYKSYSATFRIIGMNLPFEEIENNLKLTATHKHRSGDKRGNHVLQDDRWMLESPLSEDEELGAHLEWLWSKLFLQRQYLIDLKGKYHLDVFAGYRSDCDHCGTVISAQGIKVCYELEIPLELSIIIA